MATRSTFPSFGNNHINLLPDLMGPGETMKIEKGKIYELADGWGNLRVTGLKQEYESFDPHVMENKYVELVNLSYDGATPFKMKLGMFRELCVECKGYGV